MRDRLIELLKGAENKVAEMLTPPLELEEWLGIYADYLLANGVIVPPCKVGDTVYMIFNKEIRELTVISLSYMISETFKHFNLHTTNYRGAVLSYEIKDIGKTVFLTREEAEAKLKGEQ